MTVKMKMEGFRELERALAALPAAAAKTTARRAMRKELKPVVAMANAFWPGSSDNVFKIGSRISGTQMGDSQMVRGRSIINLFVGAPGGRFGTPEAHLIEFGTGPRFQKNGRFTGSVSPTPMLQPAWDMHKKRILDGMAESLWAEIEKTVAKAK